LSLLARPRRFELLTPWFEAKYSIQLSYGRMFFVLNIFILLVGAPEKIRTPDPLVRSQVLYPAELRAHQRHYILKKITN